MGQDQGWTVLRLLQWTTDYLRGHGSSSPRLDAEILLAHARGCERIDLYTAFDQLASDTLRRRYRELVQRRAEGAPVAYLVGHREFFSKEFQVTADVLIPRPETEFVLLALLDLVKEQHGVDHPWTLADVGTGSGILAICAASYLPRARILAIDSSAAALKLAQQNAARHGVAERIEWFEGDLLEPLPPAARLDFVVSNPPYVSDQEWQQLPDEVKKYEPRRALVGGQQGDEIIRRLVDQAADRLAEGGWLILEISPMLADRAPQWFERPAGAWNGCHVTTDLAKLPRVVRCQARTNRS